MYRLPEAQRYWMLHTPDDGGDGGSGGDGGTGGDAKVPSFTQEDLNRVATREKEQGKQAGRRELEQEIQTEFGVDLATAKAMLKASKDKAESEKTDAQRAKDAADAEKRAAESEKQQAALDRHNARVERALFTAGIRPREGEKDEEYDARLARARRLCTVEVGAEVDAIKADIETVKKEFPEVFGSKGSGGSGARSTESENGQRGRKSSSDKSAFERGKERALALPGAKKAS